MLLIVLTSCLQDDSAVDRAIPRSRVAAEELVEVAGSVVTADGTPIEGAWVVTEPWGYEGRTDGAGLFEIAHLPDAPDRLHVRAEGWSAASVEVESTDALTIVIEPPPGNLRVLVSDPANRPVAGALVTDGVTTAATDEDGVAWLDAPSGPIQVSVTSADDSLWPYDFSSLQVPEGGLQLAATLAGRADDATAVGSDYCLACHYDQHAAWGDTSHANPGPALDASAAVDFPDGRGTLDGGVLTLVDSTGASQELSIDGWFGTVPFTDDGDATWPLPVAWSEPARGEPELVAWQPERWFDEDGAFVEQDTTGETTCLPCHSTGFSAELDGDDVVMEASLGEGRHNELGIACERCHGPGSEHISARDEDRTLVITRPDDLDPVRTNDVCRACHGAQEAHGTQLPFPLAADGTFFRPGQRLDELSAASPESWPSGAAAAPGQQADELPLSGHEGLACIDCHASHAEAQLGVDDNALCASCHLALTFDEDIAQLETHDGHATHDPSGATEAGRCTGCHMPKTAARVRFDAASGDGDLASHLFLALSPAETLESFSGAAQDVGAFPAHACGSCHAWNAAQDPEFAGLDGDPELRETHEAFLDAYEELFP
ncbi:MAG: hypothetical protein GY913_35925 [Proteobacteria bacterium]|nr:hypothetical protein [Pseudomonadota bacterium]MCP4922320.1 hypothetical protein [Pseudomonadota bacterium]